MTNLPPNNNNNKKNGRNNNENGTFPIPQVLPRTIAMRNVPIPSIGGIVIRETPSNEVSTTIAIEVPNLIITLVREGLSKRVLAQRSRRERERQLRESGHTGSPAPQTIDNFVETVVHTRATTPHAPENIIEIEFPLPLPLDRHTNSVLSKRVIAQRARRERERQLRESATVSELFNQEPSNHTFHNNALNAGINRVPMHTELPMSQALDSAAETEVPTPITTVIDTFRKHPYHTTEAPHLQNLTMRTNSNFPSSIFEIGESSTARENVVPNLDQLPNELQELYDGNEPRSRSFWKYIQEYNAANAFTSLGVTMDDRVIPGRGPSSFVIHGELHPRIALNKVSIQDYTYSNIDLMILIKLFCCLSYKMVIEEHDEKETLKVTWVKLFWIHLLLLPGTMEKLEPPEGCTFLDGLDISLFLFKPASLYIRDELVELKATTTLQKHVQNLSKTKAEGSNKKEVEMEATRRRWRRKQQEGSNKQFFQACSLQR
ncbi:hypothetical protein GIB67_021396 [Kingdonia uniflora]|uniref:Uncharacterized protein n=1 Tax=Kingdonia uniflora TaxID=39325 RepID=A0A7J7MCW4_9MAGN|nr:hypothetical protein GIB67_021396 [Kingdonia uniflora]